jgi:hypothetical protein
MNNKPMLQIAILGEGLRISRMIDIEVLNQAISPVDALHAEYEAMCSEWNEQFHQMKRKQINAKAKGEQP